MRESLGARTCTCFWKGGLSSGLPERPTEPLYRYHGGNKELRVGIDCCQVPVFRPTEAEWRDPLGYLASIRRQVELIGMAKIVPLTRWEATHDPDQIGVKFKTKIQSVHELQWKDTVTEAKQFWAMFSAFQESTGGSKGKKKPVFAGQEIDLYNIYRVVVK